MTTQTTVEPKRDRWGRYNRYFTPRPEGEIE